jgi:hypothetical protein
MEGKLVSCWSFLVPGWDGYDIAIWTHPAPVPVQAADGKHDRDYRAPDWQPGKGEVMETIPEGWTVGKPGWSERFRKHRQGDRDMGKMHDTVIEGSKIKEISPRRWVEDTYEVNK